MNPICVICKLDLEEVDDKVFRCPKCKRDYIGEYEIMSHDDEIGTAHDEEASTIELEGIAALTTPRMATKPDDMDHNDGMMSILDREKGSKTDIKIPKYLRDSETTKVIEFDEE